MLLAAGAALLGAGLAWVRRYSRQHDCTSEAVEQINNLLPQTQCAGCGYAGCRPYAEALVAGDAINKCAPGGEALIQALSKTLNRPLLASDAAYGETLQKHVVRINADDCIGCTRCQIVCPVDAIIGAPELLHTVLPDACTGCDLCIPECPVDCIEIDPPPETAAESVIVEADDGIAAEPSATTACIRCDLCVPECPKDLMPQLLYHASLEDNSARQSALGLESCIECGLCNKVCPSQLPLSETFHEAKTLAKLRAEEAQQAQRAKRRAQEREQRQERAQLAEARRRQTRIQAIKASLNETHL